MSFVQIAPLLTLLVKRVGHRRCLRDPAVAQGGGGERAKVVSVEALSPDDPEGLALVHDSVDKHSLE
jgi:hypothetical protein